MHRRTVALLLLLASTGGACGTGSEAESGGVSQAISSVTAPPDGLNHEPAPPAPAPTGPAPAAPAPTGGFGPGEAMPIPERPAKRSSAPGTKSGNGESCWASPVLTEYALARTGGKPTWVAAATDGSLWFSDPATESVGRLQPDGTVTRYNLPEGRRPGMLAADPDGSVWFAVTGPAIAHLTRSGRLTGHALPTAQGNPMGGVPDTAPGPLVVGPDGAVWFVEMGADQVGRVDAEGIVTEYPLPGRERMHANPEGIAVGADGKIWFSEPLALRLGRIDVETRQIAEFVIPPLPDGVPPAGVTSGPDGALWFDGPMGSAIGRMTTTGEFTRFALPWQGQYAPNSATAGPDGRIWMIDSRNGQVLRMALDGSVSELPPLADPRGLYDGGLQSMSAGPEAVWFAEPSLNGVGRYACPDRKAA